MADIVSCTELNRPQSTHIINFPKEVPPGFSDGSQFSHAEHQNSNIDPPSAQKHIQDMDTTQPDPSDLQNERDHTASQTMQGDPHDQGRQIQPPTQQNMHISRLYQDTLDNDYIPYYPTSLTVCNGQFNVYMFIALIIHCVLILCVLGNLFSFLIAPLDDYFRGLYPVGGTTAAIALYLRQQNQFEWFILYIIISILIKALVSVLFFFATLLALLKPIDHQLIAPKFLSVAGVMRIFALVLALFLFVNCILQYVLIFGFKTELGDRYIHLLCVNTLTMLYSCYILCFEFMFRTSISSSIDLTEFLEDRNVPLTKSQVDLIRDIQQNNHNASRVLQEYIPSPIEQSYGVAASRLLIKKARNMPLSAIQIALYTKLQLYVRRPRLILQQKRLEQRRQREQRQAYHQNRQHDKAIGGEQANIGVELGVNQDGEMESEVDADDHEINVEHDACAICLMEFDDGTGITGLVTPSRVIQSHLAYNTHQPCLDSDETPDKPPSTIRANGTHSQLTTIYTPSKYKRRSGKPVPASTTKVSPKAVDDNLAHSNIPSPLRLQSQQVHPEADLIRILPCLHTFHAACCERWLATKPFCAVCRSHVVLSAFHINSQAGGCLHELQSEAEQYEPRNGSWVNALGGIEEIITRLQQDETVLMGSGPPRRKRLDDTPLQQYDMYPYETTTLDRAAGDIHPAAALNVHISQRTGPHTSNVPSPLERFHQQADTPSLQFSPSS